MLRNMAICLNRVNKSQILVFLQYREIRSPFRSPRFYEELEDLPAPTPPKDEELVSITNRIFNRNPLSQALSPLGLQEV